MDNRNCMEGFLHTLGDIEEPLGIVYSDAHPEDGLTPSTGKSHSCIINYMRMARTKNTPVWLAADVPGCVGGWVYMGFILPPPERIAQYVTTGWPGEEGERYMPNPSSIHRMYAELDMQPAPARYCVVKPLSMFQTDEEPLLIVFHCRGEELTGLCQLAYFALDDHNAVVMPFGAGCTNIFTWPLHFHRQGMKKAVVGGIDPSCRPFMNVDELSFTVTPDVFDLMADAAPRSFLHEKTWKGVLKRIKRSRTTWEKSTKGDAHSV